MGEEVFQVEALLVALINMEQAQFVTSLTHHEQPQGMLECLFTFLIITDNLHQGEGILIHGQALGFVDARHQHVMPGPDFDAVALASATGRPKGLALIRFAPTLRDGERKPLAIPGWMTPIWMTCFFFCRHILMVEDSIAAHTCDSDQVGKLAVAVQVGWFAIAGVAYFHRQITPKGKPIVLQQSLYLLCADHLYCLLF